MGKIRITRVEADENNISEMSIQSLLRGLKVAKVADNYYVSFGSTELEISADLMKGLIENAFMMLDYEDQVELMKLFESSVR